MIGKTPRSIWFVAGEESGDQLGGKLIRACRKRFGSSLVIGGVGGRAMEAEGLQSLFPMSDIAVMGLSAVIARLPTIFRRITTTAQAVIDADPDILVIIDSPDFTHRVAAAVHTKAPHITIIDYVSPSVWAWRPGRARGMARYIDSVLAILPFEPAVHKRLDGPPCYYVGHPLIERLGEFRPQPGERPDFREDPLRLIVLPGSRRMEIQRLMEPFGLAVNQFKSHWRRETGRDTLDVVLPAVAHLEGEIRQRAQHWPVRPNIVIGEQEKLAAFRSAHLALAASGTVTLELALSRVPMVVAYKVSKLEEQLRFLVKAKSIVLTNLILEENVIPEYIQENCNPPTLALALTRFAKDAPDRTRQIEAFEKLDDLMSVAPETPGDRAARY
ncbi:MAG: lipid-A-disaccharide synthase, partial [Methylobacteriaceae bacterium]|nr:lipid-A-disaccharide synthase [Methylobacteriaceae bacterium]